MAFTPKISAVMLTADRSPRQNYVGDSVNSLRASGLLDHPEVSFTLLHFGRSNANLAPIQDNHSGMNIVIGPQRNYNFSVVKALRQAANTNADIVLFMEDDILVDKGLADIVLAAFKSFGEDQKIIDFVSYYDGIYEHYFLGHNFLDMAANTYYGNQCFAMPNEAARSFADFVDQESADKPGFCDVWIADWLQANNWGDTVRCAVPSVAQHMGRDSNFGHTFMQAPCYKADMDQIIPTRTSKLKTLELSEHKALRLSSSSGTKSILNMPAYLLHACSSGNYTLADLCAIIQKQVDIDLQVLSREVRRNIGALKSAGLISF